MALKLTISWWKSSKLEHNLKALNNNVNVKFDLKDTGIKLSKFVKISLNVTLDKYL